MTRGEVWRATLQRPSRRSPVVLLTRPSAYAFLSSFVVAEVTTRVHASPSQVPLSRQDGMDRPCAVNLDALHMLSARNLAARIATLTNERMREVDDALRFALGLG